MTGRHKFSGLEASMTPERRARIDRMAQKLTEAIDLAQTATEPQLSEAVLHLLRQHPAGLTPRQIREKLGLQSNDLGEQSIANALIALTKSNKVSPKDRKYMAA